jgi:hypothetical protein
MMGFERAEVRQGLRQLVRGEINRRCFLHLMRN